VFVWNLLDLERVRWFKFPGKINKLTIAVDPPRLTPEDEKKLKETQRAASDAK